MERKVSLSRNMLIYQHLPFRESKYSMNPFIVEIIDVKFMKKYIINFPITLDTKNK